MRVVHWSWADGGLGSANAAYRIHNELRCQNVESRMVVSRKWSNDKDVYRQCVTSSAIELKIPAYLDALPLKFHREVIGSYTTLGWFGRNPMVITKRLRPDIINLHWLGLGFVNIQRLAEIKTPVVWRLADEWAINGFMHYGSISQLVEDPRVNSLSLRYLRSLDQKVYNQKLKAYRRINDLAIVTPSRWLYEKARLSEMFMGKRVEYIATGHDLSVFKPRDYLASRKLLGIDPSKKVILLAGMDLGDPRKGLDLLVDAIARVQMEDILLVTVGDCPAIGENIEHLPLGIVSNKEWLSTIYSVANVFVAPSREDNLPNTLIEAMACGVPSVAFDIGGMPDLISNGVTGYIAEPFKKESLSKCISWVLAQDRFDEVWRRMSWNCRYAALESFDIVKQTRKFITLYEELLEERSKISPI